MIKITGQVGPVRTGSKFDERRTTVNVMVEVKSTSRAVSSRLTSVMEVRYDFADGSVSDPVVMSAVLYVAGREAASWSLPDAAEFLDSLSETINEVMRSRIETEVRQILRKAVLAWKRA